MRTNSLTLKEAATRDTILGLLTDTEVAIVSRAGEQKLIQGDEYIDLTNLTAGIQKVSARAIEPDSAVARRDVASATWEKIVQIVPTLGVVSSAGNVAGPANTTDATRGTPLRARVEARKRELEDLLRLFEVKDPARRSVQIALDEVSGLLTGNLDTTSHVVAAELNTWLEANKHVDERHRGIRG